jgi:multidrug efflux pump subunit AcrA (membrane-fusion protein)
MTPDEDVPPNERVDGGAAEHLAAVPSRRALRTMAIVRWVLLGLVTALAAYSVWVYWGPAQDGHAAHGEDRYYCPMHPQIRSPEPGECPICHMHLEPIPEERRDQASPAAAPPASDAPPSMHPGPPEVSAVTLGEEKQRAVGLATSVVERATLADRLRVPGVISAPETGISQVRVRAPGFVEQVAVRQTGVRVREGQPLAFIYSPEIYRAQEEFIAATRWGSARGGNGQAQGTTPDIAEAARRGLELLGLSTPDIDEIARTGKPIRAIAVRAPAAGFITRFNAVLGSRAEPDMVLYEIADLSSVWVIASVHERDVNALHAGMTARFTPSGSQSIPLGGRIDLIEPVLEESTRTTRVRLVVRNRDGRLRPGQFGEVEIELPASPGLFVPRDAVIRTGEHEYLYVATAADRFEPRLVRTGLAREGRVQVLSGVAAGDRVVTRGSFMLDSESRLQTSLRAAAAPASTSQGSPAQGPSCEAAFDRQRFGDKYTQCRACERQHAGMGSMVADCKHAIPKPWR